MYGTICKIISDLKIRWKVLGLKEYHLYKKRKCVCFYAQNISGRIFKKPLKVGLFGAMMEQRGPCLEKKKRKKALSISWRRTGLWEKRNQGSELWKNPDLLSEDDFQSTILGGRTRHGRLRNWIWRSKNAKMCRAASQRRKRDTQERFCNFQKCWVCPVPSLISTRVGSGLWMGKKQ